MSLRMHALIRTINAADPVEAIKFITEAAENGADTIQVGVVKVVADGEDVEPWWTSEADSLDEQEAEAKAEEILEWMRTL